MSSCSANASIDSYADMVGGFINEFEFIFLDSDWTGARYAESAPMTMKVNVKAIGRNSLL